MGFRLFLAVVLSFGVTPIASSAETAPAGPQLFSRSALPTKQGPHASMLADMDGDGRDDLVSAVGVPGAASTVGVSVMRRRDGAGFAPAARFTTREMVHAFQVIDADGDGNLDVVAALDQSDGDEHLGVALPGVGDGSLGPEIDLPFESFDALAVGRFTSASRPGAVVARDAGLELWRSLPGFGFAKDGDLGSPGIRALLGVDLDGDGVDEIVAADESTVTLHRSLVPVATASQTGVVALRAADATGDGRPEVLATSSDGTVLAYDGSLSPVRSVSSSNGVQAAAGHLDGDGTPEVVVAGDGSTLSVFPGSGGQRTVPLARPATDVLVADVTADDHADILAVEPGSNVIEVLEGDGAGNFPPLRRQVFTAPDSWDIEVADFNTDGKMDLVASEYAFFAVELRSARVYLGDGTGGFRLSATLPTDGAPGSVAVGDVNKDGKKDLLVGDFTTGGINQFLGNGDGTFSPRLLAPGCRLNDGITAGDFNEDGYTDAVVMCRLFFNNFLTILLGSPAGLVWTPQWLPYSFSTQSWLVRVGDLNGDGHQDLAVGPHNTSCITDPSCPGTAWRTVTYFLGHGDGLFDLGRNYHVQNTSFYNFAIGDLTQDGRDDIVTPLPDRDAVRIAPGKADGTIGPAVELAAYDYPWRPRVGDVTGDGLADLVLSHGPSIVSVTPGRTGGSFADPRAFTTQGPVEDVPVADLDGDGRTDIVAGLYDRVEILLQGR